MNEKNRVYVAGVTGLVGSAMVRMLRRKGYKNILSTSSSDLDLRNQMEVERFFRVNEPEYVYLAAARVGGIGANSDYPGQFIYDNLMIQTNVIHSARKFNVKKLLFLGSSCIYPKHAEQPITENQLMTGPLEPTNSAYAIAKIAGIRMCQSYREQYGFNAISLMPTNLYGPNDNYSLETSHVLPAMIRKFHEAKDKVILWGDGSAMREFLYVDDLAEAAFRCMKDYDSKEVINIGTGKDITIKELAEIIADVVGFRGEIVWDKSKPNGTPRKLLNIDKMRSLGWKAEVSLREGIKKTYEVYQDNL